MDLYWSLTKATKIICYLCPNADQKELRNRLHALQSEQQNLLVQKKAV